MNDGFRGSDTLGMDDPVVLPRDHRTLLKTPEVGTGNLQNETGDPEKELRVG